MNIPHGMSEVNGPAEEREYFEPLPHGQSRLVAIVGNEVAAHQLHHEVEAASVGGAGIEDFRNVWMIHESESLPFRLEAGGDLLAVHAGLDDFQRHLPADRLLLLGEVYDA